MKLEFKGNFLIVTREPNDPRFHGVRNAAGESRLLYHIKNLLNQQGYNLIKKRMSKDGHMVDEMQQYLRPARIPKDPRKNVAIMNDYWVIRGIEEDLNRTGETRLRVFHDFISQ